MNVSFKVGRCTAPVDCRGRDYTTVVEKEVCRNVTLR